MVHTKGRSLLAAALAKPGRSQSWLAREIEIAQSSVGLWVHGKTRPEQHHREVLETLLGIPVDAWRTAAERADLRRARARVAAATSGGSGGSNGPDGEAA